jgi:hypothetical protein
MCECQLVSRSQFISIRFFFVLFQQLPKNRSTHKRLLCLWHGTEMLHMPSIFDAWPEMACGLNQYQVGCCGDLFDCRWCRTRFVKIPSGSYSGPLENFYQGKAEKYFWAITTSPPKNKTHQRYLCNGTFRLGPLLNKWNQQRHLSLAHLGKAHAALQLSAEIFQPARLLLSLSVNGSDKKHIYIYIYVYIYIYNDHAHL